MQGKSACVVTHPQILTGVCPWCEQAIGGSVTPIRTDDPRPTQWNWVAVDVGLRGDRESRAVTLCNLSRLAVSLERVLPLVSTALDDATREVRWEAEYACQQLARALTPGQVAWLEQQAAAGNCELAARIMLLRKYFLSRAPALRERRANHIYWLIEHHPAIHLAGTPEAGLLNLQEPAAYGRAKELWRRQCADQGSNAVVLGNAARFFLVNDPPLAEKLLLEAQTVDPANPEWHELLAHVHTLLGQHGPAATRSNQARLALVELEMAEQIRTAHGGLADDEEARFAALLARIHSLPNRARAACDAGQWAFAREFAEECLALAASDELPEYFRNDGNAVHYSHIVLGRAALREGNVEQARQHLIAAGRTEGSPNLMSFGPNMSLAEELFEQGERQAVLDYLDLCAAFWDCGRDRLALWKEQINQGKTPVFGANLYY
jgi:hypothetical protein